MSKSIVKRIFIVTLVYTCAQAQVTSSFQSDSFLVSDSLLQVYTFSLSKNFIFDSSIKLTIDSLPLQRFTYQKSTNTISVENDSSVKMRGKTIFVSYQYLSFNLKPSYSLRSLVFKVDSTNLKKRHAVVTQSEGVFSNIFGPELSKSGSITRGFSIGSNRDLTLNSGFRLQLAGKISNDIDILAALTDENTPIQPQGNTQTLQEIDNIFVEIKSPTYTATLGDFQFVSSKSEFVNVNRKLQGAKISAEYQSISPQTQVGIVGATTKGKFQTNQFPGIEGIQGPYRLTGKNNERTIIIIAGTEKVYIDGELMIRGENNDYSIDYGSAEVTFSTKRLITSVSRIVVDFEYSDRQFTRNFFGTAASTNISKDISVQTGYFREGDDPDSPIDISLTSDDKSILAHAGNSLATKSGVLTVGTDSLGIGKGNYTAIDTIIDGNSVRYYQYEIGTPSAIYSISFSNVGQGNGGYVREGIGRYKFVGVKNGQYAPLIILPSPQLHQLYSLQSSITPLQNVVFNGEFAASSFDQNRLSPIGDNANNGGAAKLLLEYSPKNIFLGQTNIGSIDVSFFERYKEKNFLSLDRTDMVEFGRKWSTDSLSSTGNSSEEIREGKFYYSPSDGVSIGSSIGTLERASQFSSRRYDGIVEIKKNNYPTLSYSIEQIYGKEKPFQLATDWFRHKGITEYTFGYFTPTLRLEEEKRIVRQESIDSLTFSSYAYSLYAPKLSLTNLSKVDVSAEVEWRNDNSVYLGNLVPQARAFTQSYVLSVREIKDFTASSSMTLRDKKFEKEFQANNINQQTTLIKIQSRYRPFSQGVDLDLYYDAATQRTAKLERVFYKVRKGEGQYVWFDANGNGVVDLDDEREFRPDRYDGEYNAIALNSESLIPIINLKSSTRVKISPARIIKNASAPVEKFLSVFSTETFVRIEERSTEPKTEYIYYLNFTHFLNPATTLIGSQFAQQDLFLFENNPDYSFRFRFNQRKGLSQYSTGGEWNYSRERSIRSRFQVANDISNQTDVVFKDDNALSASLINQPRQIQSSLLSTDFSYRPEQNLELGFKLETSQAEDGFAAKPVTASFNGQTLRTVVAFQGNGQLRAEFSREEIIIFTQPVNYVPPYELISGKEQGKNYLWSVTSEYKIGGNVQFSLQYTGRTTSRGAVIHNGRMEVRAFF
ncbi:MAG: hypothetical protein PHP42_00075 [Bacteroidota bacterium]|nr:hypothetical protein [Bacteroidota bacterium]